MKSRFAPYSFFIIGAIHNKHKKKNKFLQYMREGHAWGRFAARVQRVQRGWWRLRRRFKKRGRGWRRRLCRRVVLASAQGATALRAEGCGIAPWAMSIKSALRIHLSVSYGMIGILVISHLRWHFLERSKAGLFSPARRAVVWFSPPKAV